MNTKNLAPVYLDNQPVSLQDPKPKVSAVLSALGKPDATEVKWLQFQPGTQGKSMRSDEILDRTSEPSKPIYLTSAAWGPSGTGMGSQSKGAQGGSGSGSGQQFQPRHSQGQDQAQGPGITPGVGTSVGEGQAGKAAGTGVSSPSFAGNSKPKPRSPGGKEVSGDAGMGEEADEEEDTAQAGKEESRSQQTSE
jgi:hypothetical protein